MTCIDGSYGKDILMSNVPTMEIDYSSLHVILAYAMVKHDYWNTTSDDPYDLPVRGVNNPDHCRQITKLLFLLSFNASDEKALFKAFRNELDYTAHPGQLDRYRDSLRVEMICPTHHSAHMTRHT